MDEDDVWTPPTDAEMKVILARRERSDKISKLMGEYLLKGYKMLGISCEICGTILLKDKHDSNYCVACSELDTDLAKDDPALSSRAANSQVQEGEFNQVTSAIINQDPPRSTHPATQEDTPMFNGASAFPPASSSQFSVRDESCSPRTGMSMEHSNPGLSLRKLTSEERETLLDSESALQFKLSWATQQLKQADSIEGSIPLCELIKACADALRSVRSLSREVN